MPSLETCFNQYISIILKDYERSQKCLKQQFFPVIPKPPLQFMRKQVRLYKALKKRVHYESKAVLKIFIRRHLLLPC